jgi:MFS family permease
MRSSRPGGACGSAAAPAELSNGQRRSWTGFTAAAFAVFALLLGSNLPNSLFPLYAREYGLSPLGVTLLFATYTLLVIPAVLVLGPLSDVKGRRELLTGAILVAAVAAGLFAIAQSVVTLFIAQAVQALALGALQGTAAPTLVEQDPSRQSRRAAMIASAATIAGAAVGPILAGGLAQYAVMPQRLCYLVEIAILAASLGWVLLALPARQKRQHWQPRRPAIPSGIRRPFLVAGISAFVAWAVTGLFLSLIPSFVIARLHHGNLAVAGAVMALMLAASAVTQPVAQRLSSLVAQVAGLIVMISGTIALVIAVITSSLAVLLASCVLGGIGQGLAFMGSLGDVSEIAPADRKGDVIATYYVVVYIATALPAVGVGVLADLASLPTAFLVFAYAVIAVSLAGLAGLALELRSRRRNGITEVGSDGPQRFQVNDKQKLSEGG